MPKVQISGTSRGESDDSAKPRTKVSLTGTSRGEAKDSQGGYTRVSVQQADGDPMTVGGDVVEFTEEVRVEGIIFPPDSLEPDSA